MNCLLSGAIVRIGGAQKRADGVAGAKYSVKFLKNKKSQHLSRLAINQYKVNSEKI